jgi:hypothetical protein
MALKTIIFYAIVLLVIILLINWLTNKSDKLSSMQDGDILKVIPASDLSTSNTNTSNFTYSIWFYVEDWTYRYGQEKIILTRWDADKKASPKISLGAFQNDLNVSIQTYPDSGNPDSSSIISQTHNCNIKNVPIQSWVNALISVNGRTLDVYIDGKLVRTCVMPGVAKIAGNAPVTITPDGGFSGYTASIRYWPNATNPQEAWNVYRGGYGGSILGNFFNKYRIKVAFLEDNQEKTSFEI